MPGYNGGGGLPLNIGFEDGGENLAAATIYLGLKIPQQITKLCDRSVFLIMGGEGLVALSSAGLTLGTDMLLSPGISSTVLRMALQMNRLHDLDGKTLLWKSPEHLLCGRPRKDWHGRWRSGNSARLIPESDALSMSLLGYDPVGTGSRVKSGRRRWTYRSVRKVCRLPVLSVSTDGAIPLGVVLTIVATKPVKLSSWRVETLYPFWRCLCSWRFVRARILRWTTALPEVKTWFHLCENMGGKRHISGWRSGDGDLKLHSEFALNLLDDLPYNHQMREEEDAANIALALGG